MTELLAAFANPETIQTLSAGDKLAAGLFTTLFGMGITFTALIILQFTISLLDKVLNRKRTTGSSGSLVSQERAVEAAPPQDSTELIAVISTVLATQLQTTPDRIVIRDIVPVNDDSPAWNRAGILEQINSRF